ncbi:DMT family transporter [Tepidamorphus sp. 3E244]|uniref:DMT family transporter n=1 Tax=Tepidamorphus sp. 3E244 TaxID=3385498 RepID=UPI0038FCF579
MRRRVPVNPAPVAPVPTMAHNRAGGGIVLMAIGVSLLPIMDALAKYLGAAYGPIQIGMMRFIAQIVFTLPLALWFVGLGALKPSPFGLQAMRGMLIGGATCFFFGALNHMPLADALAIFFVSPLLVTAISALLLREQVGIRRWGAVLCGFAGAMIVIRPGSGIFGIAAVLPLCAAACFASYMIVTRQLAGRADAWSTNFQTAAFGALFLAIVLVVAQALGFEALAFRPLRAEHWVHFVGIGVVATSGHFLVIKALERAPASAMAPIGYLEMFSAAIVGWVAFGDIPDIWTVTGIVLIIASGLYVSWREEQLSRRAKREAAA